MSTVISWCFEGFWKCPRLILAVLNGFGGVHGYFLLLFSRIFSSFADGLTKYCYFPIFCRQSSEICLFTLFLLTV